MLKTKTKIIITLLLVCTLFSSICFATDTESQDIATITAAPTENTVGGETTTEQPTTQETQEDIKSGDVYRATGSVYLNELIDGNVFIVADTVTISGKIGGDLFVLAKELNIDGGAVYGNVFTCAEKITLNGTIYDLYACAKDVEVKYDAIAYRDMKIFTENLKFSGIVSKNLYGAFGNAEFLADAYIGGDLNYTSNSEATFADGAQVLGQKNFTKTSNIINSKQSVLAIIIGYVLNLIKFLIYTLTIWLVLLLVKSKFTEKSTNVLRKRAILAVLMGIVILVLVPIIAILFMIPVVTMGISLILFALYGIAIAVATPIAIISIAHLIKNKRKTSKDTQSAWYVIFTTIVIWALISIPVVGGYIGFLVILLGLGIFALSMFGNKKEETPVAVETPNVE